MIIKFWLTKFTVARVDTTVVAKSSTAVAKSSTAVAKSSTVVAKSSTAVAKSSTVVAKSSTVVAKSQKQRSIFVCEATSSAVLHQKSFGIASSFLVSESVT